MKPILVYDGDCEFCRFWMTRWQKLTGSKVEYLPYSDAVTRYPQISAEECALSVQLIEADGQVYRAAEAVYRLWSKASRAGRFWWWCYRRVPLFSNLTEFLYRFVADHRPFFWKLTRTIYRNS